MTTSHTKWLLMAVIILSVIFFHVNCHNSAPVQAPAYASLDTSVGYVGMQTCRECHQSIYETFIETGMGKSIDIASRNKSSANFDPHQLVYDKHLDFWYRPYWENDSLKIMEFRLEGKDTVHKRIETVSYIVGSGQHTNSHLMNTGGYINQMPMTFYTQKGMWDLPPGFENGGNSRFNRLIGLECMTCHNSYPRFEMGSENKYEFIEKGIGCERCHGPGETHVHEKKEGKVTDVVTGIDYSIVNPAKLSIDLQLDVCQRCHIQGNAVLAEGKSFFDFRPGMQLSEVMNVYMPVYKGHENEHIMASHVERMKLSKCFTVSAKHAESSKEKSLKPYKNALTCVTCHNPHVSVRKTDSDHFNAACNSCHAPQKNTLCTEKHETLVTNNFNCVSCHMPQSGATDIPHVSVHDHFIRVPVKKESIEEIKQFIGINCINNPDPGNVSKGKAFIAYFEKFRFGKEVLDSARAYFHDNNSENIRKNFRELVHIAFLETNYNLVIKYVSEVKNVTEVLSHKTYDNQDAWTSYQIGESFLETGNSMMAETYFSNAYRLAPLHPEFANKYASALSVNKRQEEAKKILLETVAAYPKFPPTLSNLGYILLVTEGDTLEARRLYDRALALDPDYEQAIINKAGLLMIRSKRDDALHLLSRYLKRKPNSIKVKSVFDQIVNS